MPTVLHPCAHPEPGQQRRDQLTSELGNIRTFVKTICLPGHGTSAARLRVISPSIACRSGKDRPIVTNASISVSVVGRIDDWRAATCRFCQVQLLAELASSARRHHDRSGRCPATCGLLDARHARGPGGHDETVSSSPPCGATMLPRAPRPPSTPTSGPCAGCSSRSASTWTKIRWARAASATPCACRRRTWTCTGSSVCSATRRNERATRVMRRPSPQHAQVRVVAVVRPRSRRGAWTVRLGAARPADRAADRRIREAGRDRALIRVLGGRPRGTGTNRRPAPAARAPAGTAPARAGGRGQACRGGRGLRPRSHGHRGAVGHRSRSRARWTPTAGSWPWTRTASRRICPG